MKHSCLISLALIMRDAAEDILSCLESVAGAVDEMVIVDTGSHDDSVKIVRKFLRKWQGAAPGRRGKLYQIQWRDDFAWAKNQALARCHGQWVIFLDSDESLSPDTREHLRPLVEALSRGTLPEGVTQVQIPGRENEDGLADLVEFWRENVDLLGRPVQGEPDDLAVRLLRRQDDLRYRGEVHEQLVLSDGRQARIAVVEKSVLRILHTGYRPELKARKLARNNEILLKEEREGGSTFLLEHYLSQLHLRRGEWRQAIECARRSLSTTLPVHDPLAPYRTMYESYRELEKEALRAAGLDLAEGEPLPEETAGENPHLQEARALRRQGEEVMAQGLSLRPDYPDFYYFLGGRQWNAGEKEKGKANLEKCLELAEAFPRNHPEDDFHFAEILPQLRAALIQVYRETGEDEKAAHLSTLPPLE